MLKDPAWRTFSEILVREMTAAGVTVADLAQELEVPAGTITNWRSRRSSPRLGDIKTALGVINRARKERGLDPLSPVEVLQEMGVVPRDPPDHLLVDKALRLQKLEIKLEQANARAARLGQQFGPSVVVQAATRRGRWAVSVWPAFEGPQNYHIHVADRIDIIRTDPSPNELTADEIWRDQEMKAALRAVRAIRATAKERTADVIKEDRPVSQWSIRYIGSPRDPVKESSWPNLDSLCVLSTTVSSWCGDVAAIVALCIGYGVTSVRDLVLDIQGITYKKQKRAAQLEVYDALVQAPPRRRVWSYYGGIATSPGEAEARIDKAADGETVYVILDEDDSLLREAAKLRKVGLDELKNESTWLRRLGDELPSDRVIVLPATYRKDRNERWSQALEQARECVSALEARSLIGGRTERDRFITQAADETPDVVTPIQRWMQRSSTST